ncbi:UNVERIFIED_CONTAM: hypothetical protein HDU68_008679 [Siphonaria sp. JEL0065]|nr:hypothetical protein HDU68_008679 [Siphonaria sp. JEL0065]
MLALLQRTSAIGFKAPHAPTTIGCISSRFFSSESSNADRFTAFTRPTTATASTPSTSPDQPTVPKKNTQRLLLDVLSTINTPSSSTSHQRSPRYNKSSSNENTKSSPAFPTHASVFQPRAHIVHVKTSRNNTIATLTDYQGNAIVWSSGGTVGMKKSHRASSDVAYQAVLQLNEKAAKKGLDLLVDAEAGVELRLNGYGAGREMAFRAVRAMGWNIRRVSDVTPVRHAGCRPKRKRRL